MKSLMLTLGILFGIVVGSVVGPLRAAESSTVTLCVNGVAVTPVDGIIDIQLSPEIMAAPYNGKVVLTPNMWLIGQELDAARPAHP
jgi:hypothetical protein